MRAWGIEETASVLSEPGAVDKYRRGVLGAVVGSDRYPGAAVLGVEAAYRTGIGMVRLIATRRVDDLVLARRPEVVVHAGRVEAWLIGSGHDAAARTSGLRATLLDALRSGQPCVIDAGALDLVRHAAGAAVVTPHHGELERMLASAGVEATRDDIRSSPGEWARRAAELFGVAVLLKGPETVVASADGTLMTVPRGTSWLATAGTGDVLAGILGALAATHAGTVLARPGRLAELAAAASFVHSLAAARASGGGPITALDVAEALPGVIAELLERR